MRGPGILGTLQLAVTLAFALPVGLLGATLLLDGRTLSGAAFLGFAALMVGLQQFLTSPTDLPAAAAEKVAGAVTKTDDEE